MKFGRLRYNRKVNLVILYIILILSVINLAVYPGSRSKYIHAEPEVLTYGATLYYQSDLELLLLGSKDTIDPDYSSDDKTAYFKFEFEKNQNITTSGIDEYLINIEPSNACSVVKIETNASEYSLANKTIKYNAGFDKDATTNTVILKCDVDKITKDATPKKQINVSVNIIEKVNNEEKDYISGSYTDDLENYYKKYPKIAEGIEELNWTNTTLTLPGYLSEEFFYNVKLNLNSIPVEPKLTSYLPSDFNYYRIKTIDDIYKIWAEFIASGNSYGYQVLNYVTKNYTNIESVVSMPGLDVSHTQTDKGVIHEFTVKENLIGYARTASQNTSKAEYMYFSTKDINVIDEAFKYYLDNYTYLNGLSSEEKEMILDYVYTFDPNKTNGVGYIISNGTSTTLNGKNGVIVLDGQVVGGMLYNNGRLFLDDILDYAYINKTKQIRISFKSKTDMLATYEYGLANAYKNILSEDTIKSITDVGSPIREAVLKNNTNDGGNSPYSEAFMIYDSISGYLSVEVKSDGNYTYVEVSKMPELSWTPNKLIIPEYYLNDELYDELENKYNITDRNIYSIFKEVWLENIVGKYDGEGNEFYNYQAYYNDIIKYITEYYPDLDSILNADNGLKGIKISKTTVFGKNIYQFDLENLIGYIRNNKLVNISRTFMFFTTTDKDAIDEAFEYYLDNYKYLNGLSKEEKELIIDYVYSFDPSKTNGLGYILSNGEISNIDGTNGVIVLNGQVVDGMLYNYGVLFFDGILDYAEIKVSGELKITNGYPTEMLPMLEKGLNLIYGANGKDIISSNTIAKIRAYNHEVAQAVIGYKSGEFIVYDDVKGYNLLVKVTNDGTQAYVTVEKETSTYAIHQEETLNSEQELEIKEENVDFESIDITESNDVTLNDIDPEGSLVDDTDSNLMEDDTINTGDEKISSDDTEVNDLTTGNGALEDAPNIEVENDTTPSVTLNGIESISEINTDVNLS